jgi:hypothetical protein
MGYHLTILRSSAKRQLPIPLDEAVVAAQGLEGWRYSEAPPTFEYQSGEGTCTLWYEDGELWTTNPEAWGIRAMQALAQRLGARVRGDEWETYDGERTFSHPDDRALRAEAERASQAQLAGELRAQRLIGLAIIGFFVVLGLLGFLVGRWFERP